MTKYCPEIVEKATAYITDYQEHGHIVPSCAGLSLVLGVHRSTLYEWQADDSKEFAEIMDSLNATQEMLLLNGGLSNQMNSAIAKLMLANHGYQNQQQINLDPKPAKEFSQMYNYNADGELIV